MTGKIVVDSFNQARNEYGTPFSTLTDNGVVYTARFVLGVNVFEYLLAALGVVLQKWITRPPANSGQDRTLPPNAEEMASTTEPITEPGGVTRTTSLPSRYL